MFRPAVVDPYAVLALLGFLVFLFYIIYNFLNRTGSGKRNFPAATWPPEHPVPRNISLDEEHRHLESQSQLVYSALEKFGDFSWESLFPDEQNVATALSLTTANPAAFF